MSNKKKMAIGILGLFIAVAIIISMTSCTTTDEPTPTTLSPAEQVAILNTQVTDIQSSIANLQGDINNLQSPTALNSRVDSLENSASSLESRLSSLQEIGSTNSNDIDSLEASYSYLVTDIDNLGSEIRAQSDQILAISTEVNQIQVEISTLQAEIEALPTVSNYDTEIADINQQIATLQSSLNTINSRLSIAETKIVAIQADIDQIADALTTFDIKSSNWDAMVNEWNNIHRVVISRFLSGSSYLEITTKTAGNYVAVLTLYGIDLDTIALSIPPSQSVEIISSESYGVGNTMRVVLLQPKTVSGISPNWTANKVVEVDFTGSGSVKYAQIETGVR